MMVSKFTVFKHQQNNAMHLWFRDSYRKRMPYWVRTLPAIALRYKPKKFDAYTNPPSAKTMFNKDAPYPAELNRMPRGARPALREQTDP